MGTRRSKSTPSGLARAPFQDLQVAFQGTPGRAVVATHLQSRSPARPARRRPYSGKSSRVVQASSRIPRSAARAARACPLVEEGEHYERSPLSRDVPGRFRRGRRFQPIGRSGRQHDVPNADFLFLGERAQYTIASTGSLFFKARVTANRSYSVLAWGPTQDEGEGGVNLSVTLYSDSSCTARAAGADATDYEPLVSLVPGHASDSDSLIPSGRWRCLHSGGEQHRGSLHHARIDYRDHALFPMVVYRRHEPGVRRNSQ